MGRIEKTVFISYRRANLPWALAIYQDLTHHGYDVFFDYLSIDSGNFEKVILENIKARAHFLVILTPSALERCKEPGDWLRREIEAAIDEYRNIVPIMLESFDFGSPLVMQALNGKLFTLNTYNGLRVYSEYFFEAMEKLRNKYLNVNVRHISLPSLKGKSKEVSETQKTAANEASQVETGQLTTQEWVERGYICTELRNFDEAIRCYSEAIHLEPNLTEAYFERGYAFAKIGDIENSISDYSKVLYIDEKHFKAYNNRGVLHRAQGDLDAAILDFCEAINIKPDYAAVYNNRGVARRMKGDLEGAIADYTEAIRIRPDYAEAYYNRGILRYEKEDVYGALADFSDSIYLKPEYAKAYNNRGVLQFENDNVDAAIEDCTKAIQLGSSYIKAYYNRAKAWEKKEDYTKARADYQKYLELGGGNRYGDKEVIENMIRTLEKKTK